MTLFSAPPANFLLKQILFLVVTAFIFSIASCQTKSEPVNTDVKRDTTITRSNAYSDLFFDSVRFENYITKSGWHDSLKKPFAIFITAATISTVGLRNKVLRSRHLLLKTCWKIT